MDLTAIILLILGLGIGFALGWFMKKSKSSEGVNSGDSNEVGVLKGRLEAAAETFKTQKTQIETLTAQKEELISNNAELQADNQNLALKLKEHKQEVEKLQKQFATEFENIANKLLKQNSSELAETNQKKIDEILKPLKENIKTFEQKVEDKYEKELKERTSLMEQIKSLSELNQQMREDAQSLTKALKGDSKTQGNWGELILEKILESSGLIKGEEYETEDYYTNQEGGGSRLDVIIKLPDNKQIIIDSKVSITAYTAYIESEDEDERDLQVKAHIASVKSHIDTLSKKDYSQIPGLHTPDFVLMFMPSEPSFSFTLQNDSNIYNYAWDKKIVIVSPTTLLATLKTVASVWKQERQTKNALEIAEQSGRLYDKFVGFLEDLDKIEKGIRTSQLAYDDAVKKLSTGKDNLVRKVERIKELGAKTSKQIDDKFIQDKQIED